MKSLKHSKIRNKTKVFTLTTIIQHSFGSPSYGNTQKSLAFLYKNNEKSEREIKEINPIHHSNKKNKISRNKPTKVPWTASRSNQSILKEISPGCSLEGLMLKLKLQYLAICCEELTHLKRPWCWERLKVGGEGDGRWWDGWMASPTQWTWVGWSQGVDDRQGGLACCGSWGCKKSDTTEQLNWTELLTATLQNVNYCKWLEMTIFK